MFYVTFDNGGYDEVFRFGFQHNVETSEEGRPYGSTECFIERLNTQGNWNVIRYGKARCSKEDMFHKPTGRKIALTRAVEPLAREIRSKIWRIYFQNTADLKE
jgi:hypothetical protein